MLNNYKNQHGVGMIEVLVSLILLSIAVLGFSALQLRAVEATNEALSRVQAMNIARDLAERIRINPYALTVLNSSNSPISATSADSAYIKAAKDFKDSSTPHTWSSCYKASSCTSAALAQEDVKQVVDKARLQGMKINFLNCQSSETTTVDEETVVVATDIQSTRKCIYVAWDQTLPTDGTGETDCAQYGSYREGANCVILEAY